MWSPRFIYFVIVFIYLMVSCKAYNGSCKVRGVSEPLLVGESLTLPNRCILVTCKTDKKLTGVGCASSVCHPGCYLGPHDYSKPFPKCCPKEICPFK